MLYEIRILFHFSGIVEGISVHYIKGGKPDNNFATLEMPVTVNTEGITNSVLNVIKALNHTNGSDKFCCLINVNFDGASVMPGHISRAQTCMKKMVPGLLYTHCAGHLLELAILDSIKFHDSYLEKIIDNLNRIFKFYYQSDVRWQELKRIAEMFEDF